MSAKVFVFCVLIGVLWGCQPQKNEQHADRDRFYQDARTAKVIVQESYGRHKEIALPFGTVAEAWLRIAGVSVVDDARSADCSISIVAKGEPLKAEYRGRSLYTGARLSGTIRIERPPIHRDEVSFSALLKPAPLSDGTSTVDYGLPENAPFLSPFKGGAGHRETVADKAAFDEFKYRLAVLMGRYFGRSVLLIALDDYSSRGVLRESAVEALAAQGEAIVPYLIGAFLYCSPAAEKGVGEALEKITGKKYGSDAKRWNEWFSQQRKR